MKLLGLTVVYLGCFLGMTTGLWAQSSGSALDTVTRHANFYFAQRNGACFRGTIVKGDANSLTIQPYNASPITIDKGDLAQVGQGRDLIFSSLSSWYDVVHVHVIAGETLIVTTTDGKQVRGKPVAITEDSLKLRHAFTTTLYPKSVLTAVDYVRVRPATDDFELLLEEAPWAVIFDPEFYSRVTHLEGHMKIRLYDAAKAQTKLPPHCE